MRPLHVARFAWFVLAINLLVIGWGALVRATGSGAGCGSHWPLCNGEVVPTDPAIETLIELTHRVTSGVALLLVVALVLSTRRAFAPAHPARRAAAWSMAFMIVEALVGAALVLLELVGQDASLARAAVMALHLLNTFLLVAALTLTAHLASGAPAPRLRDTDGVGTLVLIGAALFIATGVFGAIAALGDTLFPDTSLAAGLAADRSAGAHFLVRLRALHPIVAIATSLYLATTALRLANRWPALRAHALTVLGLVAAQVALGALDMVLLAPTALQLAHLVLADVAWIACVTFGARALVSAHASAPPLAAAQPAE